MKILVTAGPTWIKIDRVRILTSVFTGYTGLCLARALKKKGHRVTLVMNTHCIRDTSGLKVLSFRYFEEFKAHVSTELRAQRYDAIVHSAAVSDYTVRSASSGKIPSGKKALRLLLRPTEKIVTLIRRLAPEAVLVQFKLEIKRKGLLEDAYKSLTSNGSDFVVANALEDLTTGYKAFLIDAHKHVTVIHTRSRLADLLHKAIVSGPR